MFESIVLRRSEHDGPISAGQIAELLLFYQRVHLFIDYETLINLIQQIGSTSILRLLERPEVSAVYCEELAATHTTHIGVTPGYDFGFIKFVGHQDDGVFKSPRERLQYRLKRHNTIGKAKAVSFSKAFFDLVAVRKLSGKHFGKNDIADAARSDLLDQEYAKQAIRAAVTATPGGYDPGEDLELKLTKTELGIFVFTRIDFKLINQKRNQFTPPVEPIKLAHLLGKILDARVDLTLASFYGGDFITSKTTSSIIQIKYAELLRRTEINLDSSHQFIEIFLPDTPTVAEVIDSGKRSFGEFLNLLDKSSTRKFNNWVGSVNPDEGLIQAYIKDCSSRGWIQKLPAKIVRYLFATGAGCVNPIAGSASGFANDFIIDKLFSGWRPNHFVEDKLSQFVKRHMDRN
ncbi:hypothetical protein [Nitrosomonas aestuarii]|uniref:hypothetical protein n=1 Tax=Nitrosomonas aestuarii TaxID=52441 RepID=UPI000D30629D|nr:hypothetical protein [Nitrosomonas aestuarii]PTN12563.1 hypothetical protein C8R11_103131 [Nitrosomonas aestuarii]